MDDDCTLSIELHNSVLLQSFRWIQVCASICSIILVIYICIHYLSKTILDRVSILFARTIYLNILAYTIGIGVVQVAHLVARITAVTPCDAQIPKIMCLFRMMAASVSPAFVLLHVSITIHQALTTFRCPIRVQNTVAPVCIFITYGYAIFYGYFVFNEEVLSGTTQFCSSFTLNSEVFIIVNLNVIMALDIVNFIFALFLAAYNKIFLKNERNSFDLSRKFQRVQNAYTMEPYIPILSLHIIVHFVHFGLYSFTIYNRTNYSYTDFTILHSVVNLVPYYCLIAPLSFLIIIKLGRLHRQGRMRNMIAPISQPNIQEMCFKNLKETWDKP